MNSEVSRAALSKSEIPVFLSKSQTDENYDKIMIFFIENIQQNTDLLLDREGQVHMMIATHNKESIGKAVNKLNEKDKNPKTEQIYFAQILGMCDNLTYALGLAQFNVAKLLIFGKFESILPWILRRLQENNVQFFFFLFIYLDHKVNL
jgi:proline dehydrogenase